MSRDKASKRRGFTLVEVLAAAALATIAIVSAAGAIASIETAESKGREHDLLVQLALQKYDEVMSTADLTSQNSLSGDFSDWNDQDHVWNATLNPIDTSTTQNAVVNSATATSSGTMEYVELTVSSQAQPSQKYTVVGLLEVPPAQTTTTTTGGAAGGAAGATGRPGG